jgi:hypothetical protein
MMTPAMAPMPPLGRARAIQMVREGRLPLSFGSPHQTVAILLQDGVYRIRALVVDDAEARASNERAIARGESWMPEHYYALGKPTGTIHAEVSSIEELVATMQTMSWPHHW